MSSSYASLSADRTGRGTSTPWGPLRSWQQEAYEDYMSRSPRDFLAVATPGAGKTAFALWVAYQLIQQRAIERIIVVTPTDHLKKQWAQAAELGGIALDPSFGGKTGKTSKDYDGIVVTFAGVSVATLALRVRCERFKTLVILDEIHHGGDALTWGDAVREAFDPATRRLALTGTPFRSDENPIPFVTYEPGPDGVQCSVADYSYGYGSALADGVVRPVLFMAYSGDLAWRTSAGDEVAARLGEPMTKDMMSQAWRTALDPHGDWIQRVLEAADKRLSEIRRHVEDAGGLVIATDQDTARAYAKVLAGISGEKPTVVLSDDPKASKRIAEFSSSNARWMVAVRMVSEGVDVPRLSVGVYATATQTPLFFAQAIGRFVRARRRGETASVFLPTVPVLLELAADLEAERDHVLGKKPKSEDDLLAEANRSDSSEKQVDPDAPGYQALNSEASFDRVVYEGNEYGGYGEDIGLEEEEFLGIPGLLDPSQVQEVLKKRRTSQAASPPPAQASRSMTAAEVNASSAADASDASEAADDGDANAGSASTGAAARTRGEGSEEAATTHERLALLRRELNGLVGAWNHRTGVPHGAVHAELRRVCGGSNASAASAEQLQQRIDTIRDWAARRKS